jgi:nucleoid-associated protein YgaU
VTDSWFFRAWWLSGFGDERIYVLRACDAPADPAAVHIEPVPALFASSATDAWQDGDACVLQEMFCELTLRTGWSLHAYDQRDVRAMISARLREALQSGELVAFREARSPASFVAREVGVPASEPRQPPRGAPAELSFYEITVLDELEAPIAGVLMRVSTPAGTVTRPTDTSGRVRVGGVPAGFGSAQIAGAGELASALAGREQRPRRTAPLPQGDAWHVRIASRIGEAVTLPDAEPQRLMIVTRTDLAHFAQTSPWRELSLAGEAVPCQLTLAQASTTLALHAVATGAQAVVMGPAPELTPALPPPIPPPPIDNSLWIPPNIYVVQSGDTLVRIAARYLGDGARWREIWALNRERYAGRSPDVIFPGDTFMMPAEGVPAWVGLPSCPAPPPDAPSPAAPSPPPEWLRAAVDALHEALFQNDLGAVWRFLETIPLDLPTPAADTPPPFLEELVYRETMVELALEGRVDPSFEETEQV